MCRSSVGAAKRDGTLVKIESAERIPGPTAGQPTAGQKEGGSSAAPVGPSFDCAKAGGEVEHIICGSPRLARLDVNVAAAYKEARARGPDVKRSQVQWLAVRNHCRDEACLLEAYERRLSELKTLVRP